LLPDKQLVESSLAVVRWQRGDREAFADIVRLWERPLLFYLRRLAANEADAWELLQETWLKMVKSLGKLRDPAALPAYLYATARNTALSRMRSRQWEAEQYPEQLADDGAGDDLAALENAEAVRQALDQLPLAQREALTLFFLQDLSLEEMATLLAVPVGTVKSRLHYGKLAMRKIITQQLSGECHVR
jgi:RNA polymerase sigma-70 factor (ECF subfamily)